jgi:hypothetical protein
MDGWMDPRKLYVPIFWELWDFMLNVCAKFTREDIVGPSIARFLRFFVDRLMDGWMNGWMDGPKEVVHDDFLGFMGFYVECVRQIHSRGCSRRPRDDPLPGCIDLIDKDGLMRLFRWMDRWNGF